MDKTIDGILTLARRRKGIGKQLGPADEAALRSALHALKGAQREQAQQYLLDVDAKRFQLMRQAAINEAQDKLGRRWSNG